MKKVIVKETTLITIAKMRDDWAQLAFENEVDAEIHAAEICRAKRDSLNYTLALISAEGERIDT
jgi:hypothetical protein